MCNNGAGPACTTFEVYCGQMYVAVATLIGQQEKGTRFCDVTEVQRECRVPPGSPPGTPEECVLVKVLGLGVLGSHAIGDACQTPIPGE